MVRVFLQRAFHAPFYLLVPLLKQSCKCRVKFLRIFR
nr:MAG TPA: hypothetical protein [Caudoviricetes sp.]